MVIICDVSAWQYWRTPPVLREGWMDSCLADHLLSETSRDRLALLPLRANARESERLVHGRLLGELKGVSLPVHVMVDEADNRSRTALVTPHVIPGGLPPGGTVDLGNGLHVLSPELAVIAQSRKKDVVAVAKMMFEACGIFSLLPSNGRIDAAVNDLVSRGVISRRACAHDGIFGYSDERGRPLGFLDDAGNPLPWTPAFDRNGAVTDLWKRPPLTSVELLTRTTGELRGIAGLPEARRALGVVRDGAASPAEVQVNLLLCSGAWFGGESWGSPDLNRRVALTPDAKALAHSRFCIADCLWADRKADLEVQGQAFHADDLGFTMAMGRRAALESMGYVVQEITYEQMADLTLLDAMLPELSRRFGFRLRERTPAFLRRRAALHRALFERPYDPV